ncbi:hypothetical protein RhiirC2_771352 [Rhizophagus irregularis]|uniref:Uncharacterized protein n=1 Tax=Rhizophagus irregularis TaxID=588596 RepID=A0A2N1NUD6_9GLOM|nr:hypothetical protein RhiirC2_771352 [Rhizophagus irregularis]
MVSKNIIKTKSAESIKGRLSRLLEKIFGCRENVSPSHISNETTEYINDEVNEQEEVPNPEKDDKKVVKRKKNNVESLN